MSVLFPTEKYFNMGITMPKLRSHLTQLRPISKFYLAKPNEY